MPLTHFIDRPKRIYTVEHSTRSAEELLATLRDAFRGYADDISRLNKTQVAEIWDIPSDPQKGEEGLRELLHRAQVSHLHVSIAGARHSMGGQTIYPGGIAVNMLPFKGMYLDEEKNLLHVQAGAKWADIIPYLDQHDRSVAVMQSDNSFTVGGSLSVPRRGRRYSDPLRGAGRGNHGTGGSGMLTLAV